MQFVGELERILNREVTHNQAQLRKYLKYPRRVHSTQNPIRSYLEEKNARMNGRLAANQKLGGKGTGKNQDQLSDRDSELAKHHWFFEQMPRVIRQKNARLIERITAYINQEAEAKAKFEQIVLRNDFYARKMQRLAKLEEELRADAQIKEYRDTIQGGLRGIGAQLDIIDRECKDLVEEVNDHKIEANPVLMLDNRKYQPMQKLQRKLLEWEDKLDQTY